MDDAFTIPAIHQLWLRADVFISSWHNRPLATGKACNTYSLYRIQNQRYDYRIL